MDRIEKSDDTVIISTLVILEIIEVIRKRITEKEGYVGLTEPAKRRIRTKIENKTREFIDKMTKLAHTGKAILADPDKSVKDYLQNTLNLCFTCFGDIDHFGYCFICKRQTPMRYRYRGLGYYDLQHAINARECSAEEIMSFDKAFYQLRNIQEFKSLKINIP